MGEATQNLCINCGFCCNGVIFADVELRDSREATEMEALGLETEEETGRHLLVQPCRALAQNGCNVYAHRPECCRDFECKLLQEVRSKQLEIDEALKLVHELRCLVSKGKKDSAQMLIDSRFLGR